MPDTSIAIELSFASLPEGWKGTPQLFLQWIAENALFSASGGGLLTGQIEGPRPTSNVGIYISNQQMYVWSGGTTAKYVPLLTMPIGSVIDHISSSGTIPENFLECNGDLKQTADYPELYAVLGTMFNRSTDPTDKSAFRLPNYLGRVSVGAGSQGDVNPFQGSTQGSLTQRNLGTYFGAESPMFGLISPPNVNTTTRYSAALTGATASTKTGSPAILTPWNIAGATKFNGTMPPSIGVKKIIRAK